jgi:hypothetical protein
VPALKRRIPLSGHSVFPRKRKKQTRASPPIAWKPVDDQLLSRLSLAEAARLAGRTRTAVRKRRRMLGLPDGRLAAQRVVREGALREQADASRLILRSRTEALINSLAELSQPCIQSKAKLAFWQARYPTRSAGRQGSASR